jgi:alkylation response protein AidB-like acyl-CoA dehydrogenase
LASVPLDTSPDDADGLVAATAARIFADLADGQTILKSTDAGWKAPLWQALSEAGLSRAWVPEDCGGAGAELSDGFALMQVAGRAALAMPLAETLIAGWLLAQAGLEVPDMMLTVAPCLPRDRLACDADGRISGRARHVPFARDAAAFAVIAQGPHGMVVALVSADETRIEPGQSLADDPADTVLFERCAPLAQATVAIDPGALMTLGAIARSLQIAGSLETALAITVAYANQRVAFEKPIAKFQAVQHNLARLAGEVAAAVSAARSAADAFASNVTGDALLLEAAAAKIRCGEAAEQGAAIAHQVHGAIGFTSEHVLHRSTLRALAWRDDFGSESHWAVELGRCVARRGADELWPLVAAR